MFRSYAVAAFAALLAASPVGADPARDALAQDRFAQLHGLAASRNRIDLRYPVVLAHGVTWFNALGIEKLKVDYWNGLDTHLRELGVRVIAPEVPALGSVHQRALALKAAIDRSFPSGRVNIVAHSMGGLDARYMITMMGMGSRVASLTTVSTPHHGSWYADFANTFIFKWQGLDWLFGKVEINHDAIRELGVRNMESRFNRTVSDVPGVTYFSYAGVTELWKMPLPQWGTKLVTLVAERQAAGKSIGPAVEAALEKQIPGGFAHVRKMGLAGAHPWILPAEAGRSDGVVSTSSARWGFYLGEIEAHHLAQIGASRFVDHLAIWERVIRKLAELGY